ncbi:MAG: hypothetical protein WBP13_10160 [Methylophilaceae bacterium]
MKYPSFETIIETSVFSELFGFVIADPVTLDLFHGGEVLGRDLLSLYTTTSTGESVAQAGVALPILGVEAGFYSIVLRDTSAPSLLHNTHNKSSGWVLHVTSGTVVICGIGYLMNLNPNGNAIRHVSIPIGWYSIQISIGDAFNTDDFALEVSLLPCSQQPVFTADLTTTFNEL